MGQRQVTRGGDGDAVGHRGHRRQRHRAAGRQRAGEAAAALGLHGDHPDVRPARLDRRGDAGDQPPPPVQTTTVATSGHCSRISRPTVPCPAMTSGWSKGWMNTDPVRSANSAAATQRLGQRLPASRTSAP